MKKTFLYLGLIIFTFTIACQNNSRQTNNFGNEILQSDENYISKGQEIAKATFAAMSIRLQQAIAEGGVSHAVEYCNLAALPLVDSLSTVHDVTIRRTSLKVRNSDDMPDEDEKDMLAHLQKLHDQGQNLKPLVKRSNGNVRFYAPILINSFCLQCHGKVGETFDFEDFRTIQKIYPQDQAIGYNDGDLRGIWSIEFAQ